MRTTSRYSLVLSFRTFPIPNWDPKTSLSLLPGSAKHTHLQQRDFFHLAQGPLYAFYVPLKH